MKAIDLFCGCGGISTGLEMAGLSVIAGVDVEPKYLSSFTHNFPNAKALNLDLSKTDPIDFMEMVGIKQGELTVLAGGPPCQGFSKNVPRKQRVADSDNNQLIKTFLDYCCAIEPQVILMENVAEMKNGFDGEYSEAISLGLEGQGYTITEAVLNAVDYGVPQRRRRAFFMANRDGIKFTTPKPTHLENKGLIDLFSTPRISVWDAIGDLPPLTHGDFPLEVSYLCEPMNEFQKMMRLANGKVKNHHARFLQEKQFARLASLKPGQGHKDLPIELQVKSGYSGAYGRLTKDMIAPTITRWVFHPGSGRWGHPVDTRLLSIREVARIQGFPDWFEFIGTYTNQSGQLGNAVPPLLARVIVESMILQLNQKSVESSMAKRRSSGTFSDSEGMLKTVA